MFLGLLDTNAEEEESGAFSDENVFQNSFDFIIPN